MAPGSYKGPSVNVGNPLISPIVFASFVAAGSFWSDSSAKGRLDELVKTGFDASVIKTTDYPQVTPGVRMIVLGPHASDAEAKVKLAQLAGIVKDAYLWSAW